MVQLDRHSAEPLASQIERQLREAIAAGRLLPGSRLTSIRRLASTLEVSPNTVVAAYDRLVGDQLAESRGTQGYFVAQAAAAAAAEDPEWLEAGETHDPLWHAQQSHDLREGLLLASGGMLPPSWLLDGLPATVVQRALARHPAGLAARCPPQGMPALRERIALVMRAQGITVEAGELLTTWGATHAIDLVCRAFLQPGDAVAVETPGYFLTMDRLRAMGVRACPVERRHDGPDLAQLEAVLREQRPRVLFMQSVVHNPTGWTASAANLHKVLLLAHAHGVLVVEDDTHGHFHAGPATRLAELARLEGVIYCGSFCKALSPAIRLGYIAAQPALLKRLLRHKIWSVLTTGALNELVLLELLASGRWHKHIARLQARIGAARRGAARQLAEAGIELEHPGEDGLFLWGRVPEGVDVAALVADALANDIVLMAGANFRHDGEHDPHIRFNAAFSQHTRLAGYLRERLQGARTAVEAVRRAAERAS